jgi:hypothetical protein
MDVQVQLRGRVWPLVIAVALALVPASARPAEAGTYTVHTCKTPSGATGLSGWGRATKGAESFGTDYCARGGAWFLFMRGNITHPPGDKNEAYFTAPADTTIFAYTIWRSVRVMASRSFNYGYTLAQGSRTSIIERCYGLNSTCTALGNPDEPFAPANAIWQYGLRGVRQLWLTIGCRGTTATCGKLATDSPAKLWIHGADIHLEDTKPPVIDSVSGRPARPGVALVGDERISIAASDQGGGVRDVVAEIDGQPVSSTVLDTNGGECKPPYSYTKTVPCKLRASGALALDTSRVPDGDHALTLRVFDATGTNSAVWGPVRIRTANACRLGPRAQSQRMEARLVVGRGPHAKGRRAATTGYGRRTTLRGKLVTATGAPVGGALVCITKRAAVPGAARGGFKLVRTSPTGQFSVRLGRGPSRRIYVSSRAGDGAAVASVKLNVRAHVSLRTRRHSLRNGDVLTLKGKVRKPIPARGTLVELQNWRAESKSWFTFGTARAGRNGRFAFRYRFTRTTGVRKYVFRARAPQQPGYPYAGGASKRMNVRVRG